MSNKTYGCTYPLFEAVKVDAANVFDAARKFSHILAVGLLGDDGFPLALHDHGGCFESHLGIESPDHAETVTMPVFFAVVPK